MTEIRANAVSVDKLFRSRCHLPECGWAGGEYATYQDANAERLGHLTWHRIGTQQEQRGELAPGGTR